MKNEKTTVLLADDDYGYRYPLQVTLEDLHYRVIAVGTASEIAEHYDQIDIMVLDVRLPTEKAEGIAAADKLRRSNRPQEQRPVIFISVLREEECLRKLENFPGKYYWLVKPFPIEDLDEMIRKALDGADGGQRGKIE